MKQHIIKLTRLHKNESLKNNRFNKSGIIIFALIFVFIGSYLLFKSRAAATCTSHVTTSNFASTFSSATGGQTICLAAGNYGTFNGGVKSTPGVTITSDSSVGGTQANVIFSSVNIGGSQNITLDNLTIGQNANAALNILSNVTNIAITNSLFKGFTEIDNIQSTNHTNVLFDHDNFLNTGVDCEDTQHNAIFGLHYSGAAHSGITIQNSSIGNSDCDGIHTGTALDVLNNDFKNICENGPNDPQHTDHMQFEGAVGGRIAGNYFHSQVPESVCITQALTSFDSFTNGVIIENNVIDTSRGWGIEFFGDKNSIIRHNTLVYRSTGCATGACGEILISCRDATNANTGVSQCPPNWGVGTQVYDNLAFDVATGHSGSVGPDATMAREDHNFSAQGVTYAGCSSGACIPPSGGFANFNDYVLKSTSTLKGAASDGTDPGIYAVNNSSAIQKPPYALGCESGATNVTTTAAVVSEVTAGRNVCVTAAIGDVSLVNITKSSDVIISTSSSGSVGNVFMNGSSHIVIRKARVRSVELRSSNFITVEKSTLGGTQTSRVDDQIFFMPDNSNDVTVQDNEIAWTIADNTGNTGYGCRCYGDLNRFKFQRNWVHDIAGDGFQGVGGIDVLIDRNEIGPVGANPSSGEHSDNIQIPGHDSNLRITNNWIRDQGYYAGAVASNSGATYIHGGSTGTLLYENNLISHSQGRVEFCGLGTGGTSSSNNTIRRNTFTDLGLTFNSFPGFEWDCDSGSNNLIERNIAIDPDGGISDSGVARTMQSNLFGQPTLVTLDSESNCTSTNCNPSGQEAIGYRCPVGVWWCGSGTTTPPPPPPPSDTTPPTVSITAPASGATLSGATVTLSANASDNVGVSGVQFKVDGSNVGSEDTSSPYSISWNSTTVPNGTHTITATARDAAGNSTTSSSVSVTVTNTGNITIGTTTIGNADDNGNANLLLAQQTTLGQSATIQSMSFYVTVAVGKLRLGIYDATGSGGGPGAKKAETAEFTPIVGWNTANVATPVSLPAGTYWLAYAPSDNNLAFKIDRSTGTHRVANQTYGVMPSTYPTTNTSSAGNWSFYATLSLGGSTAKVGDINNDNSVNITDLSLLLSSYGQSTTQCITNTALKCDLSTPGDGVVNIFDLSILLSKYGT